VAAVDRQVTAVPIVQASGVDVRLGTVPILRGLDLSLSPGEVVAVTGPNGSGKSTLLRLLATLVRPAAGRLELFGSSSEAARKPAGRRRIGYVGHEAALHADLAVRENLDLIARLAGRGGAAVEEALEVVGLAGAADRPVAACSEGMRRRAELARILVCRPELLLLDEAHAALDATSRGLVDVVTSDVVGRAGAAVLVTHDPGAVATVADRMLRLSRGNLVTEEVTA
jgi:heme exporter protein A